MIEWPKITQRSMKQATQPTMKAAGPLLLLRLGGGVAGCQPGEAGAAEPGHREWGGEDHRSAEGSDGESDTDEADDGEDEEEAEGWMTHRRSASEAVLAGGQRRNTHNFALRRV